MKKLGMVLLMVGVMVLGFGLMTVFAQGTTTGSSANTDVTVTVTDSNVTMSPRNPPASVPVTFTFTNNGQNVNGAVIEKAGANNEPLSSGGNTASFDVIQAGGNFSTTWTFNDAGDYQFAVYNNGTLEQGMVVTFTVGSAGGGTGHPGRCDCLADDRGDGDHRGHCDERHDRTTTVTTTSGAASATSTPAAGSTTSTGQTPSNLPQTGGETATWPRCCLPSASPHCFLGGALTFSRRSR